MSSQGRACLLLACVLVLGGGGCGTPVDVRPFESAEEQVDETPILRIDDETVSRKSFEQFVGSSDESVEGDAQANLFREFVEFQVLAKAAREAGEQVTDAEAKVLIESWLAEGEEPTEDLVHQVEQFLSVQKYINRRLAAQDELNLAGLQRHYTDNAEVYRVDDRYRVLEIEVTSRRLAEELLASLNPGDFRQFRHLARDNSIGVHAERGGEIGVFERGMLPERFEEVIFQLKVGELSPIIESSQGFHIFAVEERTPRHDQKFYEVNQAIFEELVVDQEREKLDEIIAAELARRRIEILDPQLGRLWEGHGAR